MSSLAALFCPGLEPGLDECYEPHFRAVVRRDYYSGAESVCVLDRQALAVVCRATHRAGYLSVQDRAMLRVLQFLHRRRPPRQWLESDDGVLLLRPGVLLLMLTPESVVSMMTNLYLTRSLAQVRARMRPYEPALCVLDDDALRLMAQCLLLDGTPRLLDLFLGPDPPGAEPGLFPKDDVADWIIAQAFLAAGWKIAVDPGNPDGTSALDRAWHRLLTTVPDFMQDSRVYLPMVYAGAFSLLRRYGVWPTGMRDAPFTRRDHEEIVRRFNVLLTHRDEEPELRAWLEAAMAAWPVSTTRVLAGCGEPGAEVWQAMIHLGLQPRHTLEDLFAELVYDTLEFAFPTVLVLLRRHPAWGGGLSVVRFLHLLWPAAPFRLRPHWLDALIAREVELKFFDWTGAAGHPHYLEFVSQLLIHGGPSAFAHLVAVQPRARPVAPFDETGAGPFHLFAALAAGGCLDLDWEPFLDTLFPHHHPHAWDACLDEHSSHGTAAETWWCSAPLGERCVWYFRRRGARLSVLACKTLLASLKHELAYKKLCFYLDHNLLTRERHGEVIREWRDYWTLHVDPDTGDRMQAIMDG